MARPQKNGVDYFPLDVDFLYDKKAQLLQAEFGMEGIGIMIALWAEIYRTNGYYKKWDRDDCLLMSRRAAGCSPDLIAGIVDACVRRSLFDKRMFDTFGVLTSAGIQRRYMRTVRRRDRVPIITEYWLLDSGDENDVPANILNKLVFKSLSDGKTTIPDGETAVSDGETLQKKSKVNQSKINQSKSNQSKSNLSESKADSCEGKPRDEMMRLIDKIESLILSRPPTERELREIDKLVSEYGYAVVSDAVMKAAGMDGHSIGYLRKCADTAAARKPPSGSGQRYAPTCDIAEIERQLDEEWMND